MRSPTQFERTVWRRRTLGSAAVALLPLLALQQARADVAVIVSAKSNAQTMTSEEISEIYLGKTAAMKPIENTSSAQIRTQFYSKVTGRDEAQVKALWARLTFTGKATAPKALPSDADVVKAVAADPKAIGYVNTTAVDPSVKVVFTVK
ncbi:MAG TPA: hypothetical protein VI653_16320 [Steroidobacteraceae bacterium]